MPSKQSVGEDHLSVPQTLIIVPDNVLLTLINDALKAREGDLHALCQNQWPKPVEVGDFPSFLAFLLVFIGVVILTYIFFIYSTDFREGWFLRTFFFLHFSKFKELRPLYWECFYQWFFEKLLHFLKRNSKNPRIVVKKRSNNFHTAYWGYGHGNFNQCQ
jgi:hypothetical protein